METKDKIVLITGGANGIGFGYAIEFLRNDAAHVAILDLANSKGEEAAEKLNKEFGKGRAIFIVCDVTNPQQLEDGFAKVVKEFGGLDIVINNAGIMDDSRWEVMININFNASVRGTLLAIEHMRKDQGGRGGTIVNVSSILGFVPISTNPIYSGTKHAIIGFSRSLGEPEYYAKTGVRILTICPGATDTQLFANIAGQALSILDRDEIKAVLSKFIPQSVGNVVQGMLHIVRVGKSGSVWVSNEDKPAYEIVWPNLLA